MRSNFNINFNIISFLESAEKPVVKRKSIAAKTPDVKRESAPAKTPRKSLQKVIYQIIIMCSIRKALSFMCGNRNILRFDSDYRF